MSLIDRLRNRPIIDLLRRRRFFSLAKEQEYLPDIKLLRDEYRRKWSVQGVPEHFVNWALEMAENWAERIADFHLRVLKDIIPEYELKNIERNLKIRLYKQGLEEVAKKWLSVVVGKELD
jgi:hypothetical protein